MNVTLKTPYLLGKKMIAKGSVLNVTPDFAKELIKGGYIEAEIPIENAMNNYKPENAKLNFNSKLKH